MHDYEAIEARSDSEGYIQLETSVAGLELR